MSYCARGLGERNQRILCTLFFFWEKQGEIKLKRRSKSKRFPQSYTTAKHKLGILVNMNARSGGVRYRRDRERNANLKSIHFNGVCFRDGGGRGESQEIG
uniref:(northern house mosquito) hypothetical protein n=1 Tax=Culex pipiens TaxID=7175 RepID=A0A8D8AFY9_CULPI